MTVAVVASLFAASNTFLPPPRVMPGASEPASSSATSDSDAINFEILKSAFQNGSNPTPARNVFIIRYSDEC